MTDPSALAGLLRGYAEGDVLARRVLVDLLAEEGDPRADLVRDEPILWERVAKDLALSEVGPAYFGRSSDQARIRWWIECARFGSTAPDFVLDRVRQERLGWLAQLFPEYNLPGNPPSS